MPKARWYITESAVSEYVAARRWPDDDEHFAKAEDMLLEAAARATFRAKDERGRELWRSPRRDGALRWVVDPKAHLGGALPRVVWVGQGPPPARLWEPQPESRVAVEVWFEAHELTELRAEADEAGIPVATLISRRALKRR